MPLSFRVMVYLPLQIAKSSFYGLLASYVVFQAASGVFTYAIARDVDSKFSRGLVSRVDGALGFGSEVVIPGIKIALKLRETEERVSKLFD